MPLSAAELRARIKRLGISQTEAAERLGLSVNGLYKQLHGERKVSRQTEIILDQIEEVQQLREEVQRLRDNQRQAEPPLDRQQRRDRRLAQYLYPTAPRRK
jgi:transcriptional regulator with XRE-family HTH domain